MVINFNKYKYHLLALLISLVIAYDTSLYFLFLILNTYPCYMTYISMINGEQYDRWCYYWIFYFLVIIVEEYFLCLFFIYRENILLSLFKIIGFGLLALKDEYINKLINQTNKLITNYDIIEVINRFELKLTSVVKKIKSENKIVNAE